MTRELLSICCRIRCRARLALALATGAVLALVAPIQADPLFGVTVTDGTNTINVTGSSVFDLADDIFDRQGEFQQFDNTDFTASIDYAGLDDAIIVNGDADGQTVTIDIPSIGFSRTFNDPDEAEDFLRQEGAGVIADFIRVTNEQTLVGVTDGNPAALTATLSDDAFRNFGEFRNPFGTYVQGADGSRLYFAATSISTDVGDGYLIQGALSGGFKFTDNVGLSISLPGTFRDIEGSQTFSVGAQLGIPIKLTPETDDDQPFWWQITPYGLAAVGGSQDQLAGGVILGGGLVNFIGFKLGDFTVHSGQQVAFYDGTPIEYDDFEFETDVSQTIARVSLGGTYGGFDNGLFVTGGVIYTDFLDDAGVDNYLSPFAGVGLKLGKRSSFRIGYRGDFGDGYTAHTGEIELRFGF